MVRDYGLYGLSDKLNSPTSGVGMLVDAVGGLGNALFVQPAQSFNRLMQTGYESGNPQSAEDAFNVAGAAMVGGLAAPRPRGSIGMSGRPSLENSTVRHNNHNSTVTVIDDYNRPYGNPGTQPKVTGDQAQFRSTLTDPHTPAFNLVQRSDGSGEFVWPHTEREEALQRSLGVRAAPDLYANGGKQGAATGAALNAAGERQRLYHGSPHRFDPAAIEPRRGAHDTNQIWLTPQREYAESYGNVRSYDVDPGKQFVADKNAFNDALKELQDLYPNLGYSLMGDGPTKFHGDAVSRILSKAQREGYDSVKFSDLATDNAAVGNVHDQIAVFDRTRLRPTPEDSSGGVFANGGRPGAAVGAAANAAAERPGIRAYHGSPHDFDKFDMSKIGTGEGAQAYGQGLYFAEEEAVAKAYRDALGNYSDVVKWKGSQPPTAEQQAIINQLSGFDAQRGRAPDLASIRTDLTRARNQIYMSEGMPGRDPERSARDIARLTEQIAVVDGMKDLIEIKPPGRMYEVRINASPDDFLDWDKPLSQQSEKVRAALEAANLVPWKTKNVLGIEYGNLPHDFALGLSGNGKRPLEKDTNVLGSQLIDFETGKGVAVGKKEASDRLRDAGIPGIQYLDQGSRYTGEGTRNYVVFDDNLIEILRKYGLLGMIGGAAVAGGLQSDQNKQTDWARKMQPGDA
jgi:hypothetical protein